MRTTAQPTPLVERYLSVASSNGQALDLGCGLGRNAVFLARHGWAVDAVDISPEALDDLAAKASTQALDIKTYCTDIRCFEPTRHYDAVVANMVLHFLPKKDVKATVDNVQRWTRPAGLNIVTSFTTNNPAGLRPYLFGLGELQSYYRTWELLLYEESWTDWIEPTPDRQPERYMAARLVARKRKP